MGLIWLCLWHFPGSPVVKSSSSTVVNMGSIPGREAKITHDSWPKHQDMKKKQCCNKFNKDFKNGPHRKSLKKKKRELIEASRYGGCQGQGSQELGKGW